MTGNEGIKPHPTSRGGNPEIRKGSDRRMDRLEFERKYYPLGELALNYLARIKDDPFPMGAQGEPLTPQQLRGRFVSSLVHKVAEMPVEADKIRWLYEFFKQLDQFRIPEIENS